MSRGRSQMQGEPRRPSQGSPPPPVLRQEPSRTESLRAEESKLDCYPVSAETPYDPATDQALKDRMLIYYIKNSDQVLKRNMIQKTKLFTGFWSSSTSH